MHIIIGGAFNGKEKWVKKHYKNIGDLEWITDSVQDLERIINEKEEGTIVMPRIEKWTRYWLEDYSVNEAREIGRQLIDHLKNWESTLNKRKIILIATDISKGIVPIEKTDRDWRDLTGWFYQDLVGSANRVDEVWYGIGKRLK